MSWDFINVKTVKAAKAHSCQHCGREITKGEAHKYAAGKFDGDFFAYREHAECRAAWVEYMADRLKWDDSAPFLRDDDCLHEDKDWFFANHPVVAARLWPSDVNTAHKSENQVA